MKKKAVLVGLPALLTVVAFLLYIKIPVVRALVKSKSQFVSHSGDPRILYEPGAEAYADKIAKFLPIAVARVEQEHSHPFKKPFKVFVFATQKSHNSYLAVPASLPIRGAAFTRKIYIAPSAFAFQGEDTHQASLMHEMSHLLLRQYIGFFKRRKIPLWYSEGLANLVAGSGGEGIGEDRAIQAIKQGIWMPIEEKGGLFKTPSKILDGTGLTGPMYHQQNRMFVGYLRATDPEAFRNLLREVFETGSFSRAFKEFYKMTPREMWEDFVNGL